MSLQLYLATRKGIWIATQGTDRRTWWASDDEGGSFHLLFRDLPYIYSVTCGDVA
jgi:hypothetical protein